MKLLLSNFLNNLPEFFERNSKIERTYYLPLRGYSFEGEKYYSIESNKIELLDKVLNNFNYFIAVFDYTETELKTITDKPRDVEVKNILANKSEIRSHLFNTVYKFKKLMCSGCEELTEQLNFDNYHGGLCDECNEIYDNKTGWCGLSCCLGNGCDSSC